MPPRVLITGASGLLGRAVLREFQAAGWDAVGTAFSRPIAPLIQLDVRDGQKVTETISSLRPHLVVHCAAERRPDACEADPSGAELLNVDATYNLAKACATTKVEDPSASSTSSSASSSPATTSFIYISTDYLYDGKGSPYTETSPTSPPNTYGRLKLRGEYASLAAHPRAVILRVPVLFGPSTELKESAVTAFADAARAHDRPQTIDDWQIRVPTFTPDIGKTLVLIGNGLLGSGTASASSSSALANGGIFNYSSKDRFTRWTLVQYFGKVLNVPIDHITRDPNPPKGAVRPYDCQLDTSKLEALGLAATPTPFDEACRIILGLGGNGKEAGGL